MELRDRHQEVLVHLNCLPRKMLSLHGIDNVTEFVLHELCSENCFNLEKAAYLVDNPHFDCLKGVAAYSRPEAYRKDDPWENPDEFSMHMKKHAFNNQVREFQKSCLNNCEIDEKMLAELAAQLGIQSPGYQIFKLKNDNFGIFLYQQPKEKELASYMPDALYLLSFCPVF